MKRIVITVSPKGETQLQTTGFAGPECKEATRLLEAALGTSANERLTTEYFQPPVTEKSQLRQQT